MPKNRGRRFAPSANIEMARAFQELRRSNATVPKPARAERRQRSRGGARRAAIKSAWQ